MSDETQGELPDLSEWRVKDQESAVKLIRAQIGRVGSRHAQVFLPVPDATDATKQRQRRDYTLLMTEYGVAIGLIEMAHKAGFLDANTYQALRAEAHSLTMPAVVGVIGG